MNGTVLNFDPELKWTSDDHSVVVYIAKVGGGTIGRTYVGRWQYTALISEVGRKLPSVHSGTDFYCGMPRSHRAAAAEIMDRLRGPER